MKHLSSAFLVFSSILFTGISAQSLSWSTEYTVASGSMYGKVRPRIAITTGNIPIIMWGGGTASQPLYVARWNGSGFNTPVQVTPNGVDPFIDTWAGADMDANGNNAYAVFKVQPEMSNNIYIVKSIDGGVTWSDTTRVDNANGPYDRFPSVAVSSTGNPAVMFMTFDMSWLTPGYVVTNSPDGGATFNTPVNVSMLGGSDVCDCCPGYMIINGNTQAATWRRNSSNRRDMWAGVSTNGGTSFPTGMDVDNTDWMLSACPSTGPDPFLVSDSLYTVFMSGASGDERVYINSHNITTQADGFTAMLDPNVPSSDLQNYPFISGNGDTMVVVYQSNSGGNLNVWCAWSVTGPQDLFNNITMVNSPSTGVQMNPHVYYSNGKFHFTYTDNVTGNVIYKYATFVPNSVNEETAGVNVHISPNPASGDMFITLGKDAEAFVDVEITDISGRTLESISLNGASKIKLEHRSAGMYIVNLRMKDGSVLSRKILFQ